MSVMNLSFNCAGIVDVARLGNTRRAKDNCLVPGLALCWFQARLLSY